MNVSLPSDVPVDRLSRRRFGKLAALGLATGAGLVGTGAGLTGLAPSALAEGTAGHDYYDRARTLAGKDPVLLAIVTALTPGVEFPEIPVQEPVKLFDDVVMLSTGFVNAMAILTDDGIVLIDALQTPDEAESVIVSGLREVGADPAAIKYVVVTHGHDDHFGGAQFLADRYGTRVLMSPTDWDLVADGDSANAPVRDLDIADGQRLTLGGTTISLHYTPGHTPGTVSPIFPVRNGAKRHTAMLWGGTNPPAAVPALQTYLASIGSFRTLTRAAKVDVELSNHFNDHGRERADQLRADPEGPNPFVLGQRRADRFLAVMDLMLHGRIADAEAGS